MSTTWQDAGMCLWWQHIYIHIHSYIHMHTQTHRAYTMPTYIQYVWSCEITVCVCWESRWLWGKTCKPDGVLFVLTFIASLRTKSQSLKIRLSQQVQKWQEKSQNPGNKERRFQKWGTIRQEIRKHCSLGRQDEWATRERKAWLHRDTSETPAWRNWSHWLDRPLWNFLWRARFHFDQVRGYILLQCKLSSSQLIILKVW